MEEAEFLLREEQRIARLDRNPSQYNIEEVEKNLKDPLQRKGYAEMFQGISVYYALMNNYSQRENFQRREQMEKELEILLSRVEKDFGLTLRMLNTRKIYGVQDFSDAVLMDLAVVSDFGNRDSSEERQIAGNHLLGVLEGYMHLGRDKKSEEVLSKYPDLFTEYLANF